MVRAHEKAVCKEKKMRLWKESINKNTQTPRSEETTLMAPRDAARQ